MFGYLSNIDLQGISGPEDVPTEFEIARLIDRATGKARGIVREARTGIGLPIDSFFSGGGGLILAVVAGFALLLISKPDKTGSAQTPKKISAVDQINRLRKTQRMDMQQTRRMDMGDMIDMSPHAKTKRLSPITGE